MNSNTKGAIAEQAIVLAATKLRVPVWRPVAEHGRTDLALDIAGELWRVPAKWGRLNANGDGDVVIVVLRTSRYTPRGQVCRTHGEREVDLFAVYCGELDRAFLLPASLCVGKHCISLRLTASRNGQRACINLADDFTFEGAVAQLARASRWQREGQGFESPQLHSSPLQRPKERRSAYRIGDVSRPARHWMERVERGEEILVTFRGRPRMRVIPAVGR
jgi:PD-(D/E)XK endonuclease